MLFDTIAQSYEVLLNIMTTISYHLVYINTFFIEVVITIVWKTYVLPDFLKNNVIMTPGDKSLTKKLRYERLVRKKGN